MLLKKYEQAVSIAKIRNKTQATGEGEARTIDA